MKLHRLVCFALAAAGAAMPAFSQTFNQLEELVDSLEIHPSGSSAAISAEGEVIAVGHSGTPNSNPPAFGHVRVYYSGTGQPAAELTPNDYFAGSSVAGNSFGASVAVTPDGSAIFVGDPTTGGPGVPSGGSGAVYLFQYAGLWSQTARLTPSAQGPISGPFPHFGESIALNAGADTALIGCQGGAFVFRRSGGAWVQSDILLPSSQVSPYDSDYSVSLSADGNTALVGEPRGVGRALIFTFSGGSWSQAAELDPPP